MEIGRFIMNKKEKNLKIENWSNNAMVEMRLKKDMVGKFIPRQVNFMDIILHHMYEVDEDNLMVFCQGEKYKVPLRLAIDYLLSVFGSIRTKEEIENILINEQKNK